MMQIEEKYVNTNLIMKFYQIKRIPTDVTTKSVGIFLPIKHKIK